MNLYWILFAAIFVAVLMGMMTRGFHNGLVSEIRTLLSICFALALMIGLAGFLETFRKEGLPSAVAGFVLLLIFIIAYKLLSLILSSIKIVVSIPVIKQIDQVLGLFAGLAEGFAILYLLEYLLRHYLLV